MKAVVFTEYGTPDVLQVKEIPKPTPKENEILIRIRATGIAYGDLMVRDFKSVTTREFNMPSIFLPLARMEFGFSKPKINILGSQYAGEVEALGKDVTLFKEGDAVFGYRGSIMGANAEYLCVAEDSIVALKPQNMSFEEASTVPYGALTALTLLKNIKIEEGQKVLIIGASGSIGSHAVQLAKHQGAEVTGVCGTPRIEFVKAIGADHIIDYSKETVPPQGEQYDLIVDVLGRSSISACKQALKAGGTLLFASFKLKHLFQMLSTSFVGDKKVICAFSSETKEDLVQIKALVEQGVICTVIDRSYPLEETAEAHRYIETGHKQGNVVITVSS